MKNQVALLCLLAALPGCDAISMDAVPSREQIMVRYPVFLVEPVGIAGIYANRDVDAALFSYVSHDQSVLPTLAARLAQASWQVAAATPSQLVVFRSKSPGHGELGLFSLEVAKVGLVGTKVCVGYLQMDSRTALDIDSRTAESTWASAHLWPKYEACKGT